jgi:hypothetical protein
MINPWDAAPAPDHGTRRVLLFALIIDLAIDGGKMK